jgi:restriction system protein
MNNSEIRSFTGLDLINPDRGYWFVRTDSGVNFETYLKNSFIGIGWNRITLEDIVTQTEQEVKDKIAKIYGIDLELAKGKGRATAIYNKLKKFKDIQKGDVVIIPSHSSGRLAFGIISDSNVYIDIDKTEDCEYYKRKKVQWVMIKPIDSLDAVFFKIKSPQQAIIDIKPYESYVDRIVSTFYFKNNTGNLVFNVNKDEDINLEILLSLISSIRTLLIEVNSYFNYQEDIGGSAIKLSLQSKGTFVLKVPIGKSLATFGLIFMLFDCQNKQHRPSDITQKDWEELQTFIEAQKDTLTVVQKRMDELEVDKGKINDTFR